MADTAYARRYAQAIFQIAGEKGDFDKWQTDMGIIAGLAADIEAVTILENPKLPPEAVNRALATVLSGASPLAINLVKLLLSRNNLSLAVEINAEFLQLMDARNSTSRAEVITAVPLSEEEKAGLEERLEKLVNKKVIIEPRTDPALLGGIVVKIDNMVLDGSTKGRLQALKRRISRAGGHRIG